MRETPLPLDDPTTEDRQKLLLSMLQRYVSPYAQNCVRAGSLEETQPFPWIL
jgi:hypothetical protein